MHATGPDPHARRRPGTTPRELGTTRLLLLAAVVLLGVAAAALLMHSEADEAGAATLAGPSNESVSTRDVAAAIDPDGLATAVSPGTAAPVALARVPPSGRFGPPIPRDGRTSSLSVGVTRDGMPTPARVSILAGADAGHVLPVDDDGLHRADELFPGRVVLEITPAGGPACRRELLLRHRRSSEVSFDFGDHGSVSGVVRGPEDEPLAGVQVELDGLALSSDRQGRFSLGRRVSGVPLITLSAPGLATHRQAVTGPTAETRDLSVEVSLRPAARLVLDVPAAPGVDGEVEIVLVPSGDPSVFADGALQPTYPWSDLYPLRVLPGRQLVLDDLPTCHLDVLAFHARGRGRPASAWCRPETDCEVAVEWVPVEPLEVTVVRSGEPASEARVALRLANPASERVLALGAHGRAADRFPLSQLGLEHVGRLDAAGRTLLGLDARRAFVVVSSADGGIEVVRAVERGAGALLVDLDQPDS